MNSKLLVHVPLHYNHLADPVSDFKYKAATLKMENDIIGHRCTLAFELHNVRQASQTVPPQLSHSIFENIVSRTSKRLQLADQDQRLGRLYAMTGLPNFLHASATAFFDLLAANKLSLSSAAATECAAEARQMVPAVHSLSPILPALRCSGSGANCHLGRNGRVHTQFLLPTGLNNHASRSSVGRMDLT